MTPICDPDRPACVVCELPSTQRCSRCKTKYCSDKCQYTDWYFHRWMCKPSVELYKDDARPSPNHSLVIMLPRRSMKPKFAWFNPDAAGSIEKFCALEPGQAPNLHSASMMPEIRLSSLQNIHQTTEELILLGPDQSSGPGIHPVNRLVQGMGQDKGFVYPWRGRLMLARWDWTRVGRRGPVLHTTGVPVARFWKDMRCYHFRRAVDFFCWYRLNPALSWPERLPEELDYIVSGVKINCAHDMWDPMSSIPPVQGIFMRGHTTKIEDCWTPLPASQRFGLPMLYRMVYCNAETCDYQTVNDVENEPVNDLAHFLLVECTPVKNGKMTLDRTQRIYPFIVMREDDEILLPSQINIIYSFLWSCVCRATGNEPEFLDQPTFEFDAEIYYQANTKANFLDFWGEFTAVLRQQNKTVPELPFPAESN
ncbi:hypothetical protein GQ53DRAFT_342807 [Thozetella sp. PMI_491]|nr:hypothetical protein GQ53DRAFT_342807 [Thozetella sp. PMI_491]